MTCQQFESGAVVCRPDDRFLRKEIRYCPVDQCRTEMVARYEAWYGMFLFCCKCGDSWCDGEMHARPFERGWRRKAVKRHRAMWDRASHGQPPTFEELCPEYAEEAS
ncbi:hypothetical protein ABZ215_33545 [Amycolatopsis sp. NPDC006131]|uniref:hypothetical protein n=1 Tax=Amycolatopsis sp. NPDC006131 TaxID=3156731 RepID=UPI0033B81AF1